MNYLKIKIEPKGCNQIHPQLEKEFIAFMLCGGWIMRINRDTGLMTFYTCDPKGKQKKFKVQKDKGMCELGRSRYNTFLKMYLVKGGQFLRDLEKQLANIQKVNK